MTEIYVSRLIWNAGSLSWVCFFVFKQKTAYEIMPSLVGSEMCIRDRVWGWSQRRSSWPRGTAGFSRCLLYTSDAADDLLCVDLGGRRIIKKKKKRCNRRLHPVARTVQPHQKNSDLDS